MAAVSLGHECGGRSWKFCLGFLCTGARFNVLLPAFPGKGCEALGMLVLENCKVGITFTVCTRNGGVLPPGSLQVPSNTKLAF